MTLLDGRLLIGMKDNTPFGILHLGDPVDRDEDAAAVGTYTNVDVCAERVAHRRPYLVLFARWDKLSSFAALYLCEIAHGS